MWLAARPVHRVARATIFLCGRPQPLHKSEASLLAGRGCTLWGQLWVVVCLFVSLWFPFLARNGQPGSIAEAGPMETHDRQRETTRVGSTWRTFQTCGCLLLHISISTRFPSGLPSRCAPLAREVTFRPSVLCALMHARFQRNQFAGRILTGPCNG